MSVPVQADQIVRPNKLIGGFSHNLLARIFKAEEQLIRGLESVERTTGWADPTIEGAQYFWTTVEVLTALLELGKTPENFLSVVQQVENNVRIQNGAVGWTYEGFDSQIDVFVTSDVLRLMLVLRRFSEAKPIIESLQRAQNPDGGWGASCGDPLSLVHMTSVVIRTLIAAAGLAPIATAVDSACIARGLDWLYEAQNDSDGDSGWGAAARSSPSQLSQTAAALWALLAGSGIKEKRAPMSRGLTTLEKLAGANDWNGRKQEIGVQLSGSTTRRHIVAGPGATFGIPVFAEAIHRGLRSWPNPCLVDAMENLLNRCRPVDHFVGWYVTPSDDGGPAVVWNSAFALQALAMAKEILIAGIGDGSIERATYQKLLRRERLWRTAAIVLLSVLVVPRLLVYLNFVPTWFQQLGIFWQSVLTAVVPVAIERTWKSLRRSNKKD